MPNRNNEQTCQHGQQISSASFFLMGIAVGSAAALLFAPLSGRGLRNLLGERVDGGRQAVKVQAREAWAKAAGVAEAVETTVEAGKRYVSEERQRVENAILAGKQAYQASSTFHAEADGTSL